jgi:hypothetical protein
VLQDYRSAFALDAEREATKIKPYVLSQQKRRNSTGTIDQTRLSPRVSARGKTWGDIGRLNKFMDKLEMQLADMSPRRITDSIVDVTHPKHVDSEVKVEGDTAVEYFKRVESKNTAEL